MKNSFESGGGNNIFEEREIQERKNMLALLNSYVDEHDLSVDDVELAYHIYLGATEAELGRVGEVSSEVYELTEVMKEYTEKHLPVSDIAQLIEGLRRKENSHIGLMNIISALPITEREKDVIASIPQDLRGGNLAILDESGNEVVVLKIKSTDESERKDLEIELSDRLSEYKDVVSAIQFEEM